MKLSVALCVIITALITFVVADTESVLKTGDFACLKSGLNIRTQSCGNTVALKSLGNEKVRVLEVKSDPSCKLKAYTWVHLEGKGWGALDTGLIHKCNNDVTPKPVVVHDSNNDNFVREKKFTIGSTTIYGLKGKKGISWKGKFDVDADGAPNAYGPAGSCKALDYLANAGKPGNWWGIVTVNGKPYVQKTGDPYPGCYVSTTSLLDGTYPATSTKRYVDSNTIPYIVLNSLAMKNSGAKLGDFAYVEYNTKSSFAIVADVGPSGKIGEGSIALAKALGITSNPKAGGVSKGVKFVVFPGSGNGKPRTLSEIHDLGDDAFENWGGEEALNFLLQ